MESKSSTPAAAVKAADMSSHVYNLLDPNRKSSMDRLALETLSNNIAHLITYAMGPKFPPEKVSIPFITSSTSAVPAGPAASGALSRLSYASGGSRPGTRVAVVVTLEDGPGAIGIMAQVKVAAGQDAIVALAKEVDAIIEKVLDKHADRGFNV